MPKQMEHLSSLGTSALLKGGGDVIVCAIRSSRGQIEVCLSLRVIPWMILDVPCTVPVSSWESFRAKPKSFRL